MYNKKFTVTVAEINAGTVKELDIILSIPVGPVTLKFYGRELQIVNNCGAEFGFNIIVNETEYKKYVANPANFGFNRVPKNVILNRDIPRRVYKLLIKGLENTATEDLIVELLNYKV